MPVLSSTVTNDARNQGPESDAENPQFADDDNFSTNATFNSYATWGGFTLRRGLVFDFGASAIVSSFNIFGSYVSSLSIVECGPDGTSWSPLVGVWSGNPFNNRTFDVTVGQADRYLCLRQDWVIPGLQYVNWITIDELTINGEFGVIDPGTPPPDPILIPPEEPVILFPVVRGTAWVEPE